MKPSDLQALYQRLRQEADKVIVGLEEPFELLVDFSNVVYNMLNPLQLCCRAALIIFIVLLAFC